MLVMTKVGWTRWGGGEEFLVVQSKIQISMKKAQRMLSIRCIRGQEIVG